MLRPRLMASTTIGVPCSSVPEIKSTFLLLTRINLAKTSAGSIVLNMCTRCRLSSKITKRHGNVAYMEDFDASVLYMMIMEQKLSSHIVICRSSMEDYREDMFSV